jgi:hypothetical protein
MARKVQTGHGTFIKHTNKKRPGRRHSKRPNKRKQKKFVPYNGQGRKQ